MTFGVRIFNDSGLLQVHDDYMIPQFVGKITTVNDNIIVDEGGELGFESRSYSGVAPNFSGRDVMVFWHFPEGVFWYPADVFLPAAVSGANIGLFALCAPSAVITGTPTGYVFALGPVIASAEQFCLRMWNAAGTLMFDSGSPHLSVNTVASGAAFPVGSEHTTTITMPAKPAILLPQARRTAESYEGALATEDGNATFHEWIGVIRRTGSTSLATRMLDVRTYEALASNDLSNAGYSEDQTYGNTTGLVMPIINAALYD